MNSDHEVLELSTNTECSTMFQLAIDLNVHPSTLVCDGVMNGASNVGECDPDADAPEHATATIIGGSRNTDEAPATPGADILEAGGWFSESISILTLPAAPPIGGTNGGMCCS